MDAEEQEVPSWEKPTFGQDVISHFKSLKFRPWHCSPWYLVFVLAFVAPLIFAIRFQQLLPGRAEPTSAEVYLSIRTVNLVCNTLIVISPIAFFYVYYRIPQKHFAMMIWAVLVLVFCLSLYGFANQLAWKVLSKHDRTASFIEHAKAEYLVHTRQSLYQRSMETKNDCCGVDGFMDYTLNIFFEYRVPDHCCKKYTKGCGRHAFVDTPLAFPQRRPPPADDGSACLFDSIVTPGDLSLLVNFEQNASSVELATLIKEFNDNKITRELVCDDLTLQNYLDPICLTYTAEDNTVHRVFAHKFKWCFTVYYNDTTKQYGKLINDKIKYFKPDGCYKYLEEFADTVIDWGLISMSSSAVISVLLLVTYLKLYEEYRKEQLALYPLPAYLERIPDEDVDDLPRGLGRRCRVHHLLAMVPEDKVTAYVQRHPSVQIEAFEKLEKDKKALKVPIESVPQAAFIQQPGSKRDKIRKFSGEDAELYEISSTASDRTDASSKERKKKKKVKITPQDLDNLMTSGDVAESDEFLEQKGKKPKTKNPPEDALDVSTAFSNVVQDAVSKDKKKKTKKETPQEDAAEIPSDLAEIASSKDKKKKGKKEASPEDADDIPSDLPENASSKDKKKKTKKEIPQEDASDIPNTSSDLPDNASSKDKKKKTKKETPPEDADDIPNTSSDLPEDASSKAKKKKKKDKSAED